MGKPWQKLQAEDRVAIFGFGLEGQAALTWLVAALPGVEIDVFAGGKTVDPKRLPTTWRGVCWSRGPRLGELANYALVVVSPGVPPHAPELAELAVPVVQGTQIWLAENPQADAIVVTGTKGKSTTASLLAHCLKACGVNVELAGNIGKPLLALGPARADTTYVFELSSYQLHAVHSHVSEVVYLNLHPEHLTWHGSTQAYFAAKLSLLEHQPDRVWFAHDSEALASRMPPSAKPYNQVAGWCHREGEIWRGDQRWGRPDWDLPGGHNLSNLSAVLSVVEARGFALEAAWRSLRDFAPLPHRLQLVGNLDGVRYINDSIATTPAATLAALDAFPRERTILLLGGYDRGVDRNPLTEALRQHPVKWAIGIGELGAHLTQALTPSSHADDLRSAVKLAAEKAAPGDIVLLSPSAPSYDAFASYSERGEAFAHHVRSLNS